MLVDAEGSGANIGSSARSKEVAPTTTRNPNLASSGLHSIAGGVKASGGDGEAESWTKNIRGGDLNESLLGTRGTWWWTGKAPVVGQCPGVDKNGVIRSLAMPETLDVTRQDILDYFDNTWALTEVLFSSLVGEEAFYRPPYHHLRHPMIFYYVHPASFYINKFRVAGLLKDPLNAFYEEIFETGVDEMSWDDMSKNDMSWPSVAECHAYRKQVYATVRGVIESHPALDQGYGIDTPGWAVVMCLEHERIHLETSSCLLRELPLPLLRKPKEWPAYHPSAGSPSEAPPSNPQAIVASMIDLPAAKVTLGKPRDFPSFGWDNEYGSRTFDVPSFKCAPTKVSNASFLLFVKDGGYAKQEFWSKEGWAWKTFRNAKWPAFWVPSGPQGLHQYRLRLIFDVIDMPMSWPAVVNYHEAHAFCNWLASKTGSTKGHIRMLTELEHRVIEGVPNDVPRTPADDHAMKFGGKDIAEGAGVNGQLAFGAECPVDAMRANALGFHDVFGNVWEWGEGMFCALEGFEVHPFYDDFSTPCFDGEHQVLMGGSFISTGDELSVHARFHFRPHFSQHAGFRVVLCNSCETSDIDAPPPYVGHGPWKTRESMKRADLDNVYETEKYVSEYLAFHFGQREPGYLPYSPGPDFALDYNVRIGKRCWELLVDRPKDRPTRGLDIGCGVGAACFEMARHIDDVVGLEYSHAFVSCCNDLRTAGSKPYFRMEEGKSRSHHVAVVDPTIDRSRCSFAFGDACDLSPDLGDFDVVLLSNLLCRLPEPMACLGRLPSLVRKGGFAVIASPYSWLEQFTSPEKWLGGRGDGGCTGKEELKAVLAPHFEVVSDDDMPFLIREHTRKYQLVYTNCIVFKRKEN